MLKKKKWHATVSPPHPQTVEPSDTEGQLYYTLPTTSERTMHVEEGEGNNGWELWLSLYPSCVTLCKLLCFSVF